MTLTIKGIGEAFEEVLAATCWHFPAADGGVHALDLEFELGEVHLKLGAVEFFNGLGDLVTVLFW